MRPPLDGAVVLLTGASSGIGEALARQMAPTSKVLVLVARRAERLERLAAALRAAHPALTVDVAPCDLADEAAREALVARVEAAHGGVDVLVNNAGLGDACLLERARWDKLNWMLQVNVMALTWLCWRVLPGMVTRGRGGILNISSGFGLTWVPVMSVYVASKHYVTALSDSLRTELRGSGVVVTQVCPGPVVTEFEDVMEAPGGIRVPRAFMISAEACARGALRGFRRGAALVIPGFLAWLGISLGRVSPRWVLRLLYAPIGGLARRRF